MMLLCTRAQRTPSFLAVGVVSALVAILSGCGDPASSPSPRPTASSAAPEASVAPAYPELPWPEVAKRIEDGTVVWIVPALDRRVFVTTKSGEEHVTTAPTDSAVHELRTRVDPTGQNIVVAKVYSKYREVLWRDVPALVSRSEVYAVQQNGGRRVLIETTDGQSSVTGFYVTLQPRYGDITPLVPKKYPSGMFVKHIDVREIGWQAATEQLMAGGVSSVFLGHGDRVFLTTSSGQMSLTIEPTPEAASDWLKTYRPDLKNITVE